ncbi:B3 domain-containing protein At2g31720-like [Brassica rapa]|nr:B3 domain-containing protein At2g31720-like [Brassica rapa]
MKTFKGREGDAKMIFEKAMTKTDLATNQGRLLMPFNQMAEMDFLNEAELKILEEHHKGDYVKKGVDVVLLDRSGKKRWNLNMRIWKMSTCFNYALCAGWNQVVLDNDFQRNQTITLWSFHSLDGTLYFAFDPPTPALSLVVISESEDPFVCEEANRRLYPFPKRRTTLRVCVPPPTSDSSNLRL